MGLIPTVQGTGRDLGTREQRRLAAIVSADVADYSRLMGLAPDNSTTCPPQPWATVARFHTDVTPQRMRASRRTGKDLRGIHSRSDCLDLPERSEEGLMTEAVILHSTDTRRDHARTQEPQIRAQPVVPKALGQSCPVIGEQRTCSTRARTNPIDPKQTFSPAEMQSAHASLNPSRTTG
jgi:hypothetical protein